MMGRLVADPELRHTTSGVAVATFRLAVDRPYKKDGKEVADFFNVVAWRGLGEFAAKYFKKGKPMLVQGSFENRSYKDKEGNNRWVTELIANQIRFAGDNSQKAEKPPIPDPPPEKKSSISSGYAAGAEGDFEEIPSDDDLPF
jgi:single-strand DNA-binding protein